MVIKHPHTFPNHTGQLIQDISGWKSALYSTSYPWIHRLLSLKAGLPEITYTRCNCRAVLLRACSQVSPLHLSDSLLSSRSELRCINLSQGKPLSGQYWQIAQQRTGMFTASVQNTWTASTMLRHCYQWGVFPGKCLDTDPSSFSMQTWFSPASISQHPTPHLSLFIN